MNIYYTKNNWRPVYKNILSSESLVYESPPGETLLNNMACKENHLTYISCVT